MIDVTILNTLLTVYGANAVINQLQQVGHTAFQSYKSTELMRKSLEALSAKAMVQSGAAKDLKEAREYADAQAKGLMEWTSALGILSPYADAGITEMFKLGLSFGFTIDQAKDATEVLVDFGSAMGHANLFESQGAMLALGQAFQKGRFQGEEALQLVERGIPVWEYLERELGKTTAELQQMSSKGLIPGKQALEAISKGIREDFGGSAAEASLTIEGLVSTIDDLRNVSSRELLTPAIVNLQPFFAEFVDMLQSDTVSDAVLDWSIKISEGTERLLPLIPVIRGIGEDVWTAVDSVTGSVAGIGEGIGHGALGIYDALQNMPDSPLFNPLTPFGQPFVLPVIDFATGSDDISDAISEAFDEAFSDVSSYLMDVVPNITEVLETLMYAGGINAGMQLANGLWQPLRDIPMSIWGLTWQIGKGIAGHVPTVLQSNLSRMFLPELMGAIRNPQGFQAMIGTYLSGLRTNATATIGQIGNDIQAVLQSKSSQAQTLFHPMTILKRSSRMYLNEMLAPAAFTAIPLAIGGVISAWQSYERKVDDAVQAALDQNTVYAKTTDQMSLSERVLNQAAYAQEQLEFKIWKTRRALGEATEGTAEFLEIQQQLNNYLESLQNQEHLYEELEQSQKRLSDARAEAEGLAKAMGETGEHGIAQWVGYITDPEAWGLSVGVATDVIRSLFGFGEVSVDYEVPMSFRLATNPDQVRQELTKEQGKIWSTLGTALANTQAHTYILKAALETDFLSGTNPDDPVSATQREKLEELVEANVAHKQKLVDMEDAHDEKLDALAEQEVEKRKQALEDRQRTELEIERDRQQAILDAEEALQEKLTDITEQYTEERQKKFEDSAEQAHDSSVDALDSLAETNADFIRDTEKREEDWVKKQEILAKQGAYCKIPEEQKAHEEEEQQRAEAYLEAEAQQKEHLGRMLMDYAIAQGLQHNMTAEGMDRMITGIATLTGVYDSGTAALLGDVFGGITHWAETGGDGVDMVLSRLEGLPAAATEAKLAEDRLTESLTKQAVARYQQHGDIARYQQELSQIPNQVATQMHFSQTGLMDGSSVWKSAEDINEREEEARAQAIEDAEDTKADANEDAAERIAKAWFEYEQQVGELAENEQTHLGDMGQAWLDYREQLYALIGPDGEITTWHKDQVEAEQEAYAEQVKTAETEHAKKVVKLRTEMGEISDILEESLLKQVSLRTKAQFENDLQLQREIEELVESGVTGQDFYEQRQGIIDAAVARELEREAGKQPWGKNVYTDAGHRSATAVIETFAPKIAVYVNGVQVPRDAVLVELEDQYADAKAAGGVERGR